MRRLGGIAVVLAGSAVAQPAFVPAPSGPTSANAPKVSELVIPGGPAPKVAATFPAQGATVSAGELVLKVVFDLPMTPSRWSFAAVEGAAFPVCLSTPRLLADRKTFVLLCQVKADTDYRVDLGAPPGFAAQAGREMAPSALAFHTGDDIVADLHGALEEAGLTDADEPIMTWNDDGASPPKSPTAGGRP